MIPGRRARSASGLALLPIAWQVPAALGIGLAAMAAMASMAPAAGEGPSSPIRHAAESAMPRLPVEFDSEVVRLRIGADTLLVEGLYRFTCRVEAPERITLFYPYPRDSLLGEAATLTLEARPAGGAWRQQAFTELPGGRGARWDLTIAGADTLEARTVYRQRLLGRHARYIVTTTAAWGRPLRHARFEICLPAGSRALEFSYPFQPMTSSPDCHIFEAGPFLPERDIEVTWAGPE